MNFSLFQVFIYVITDIYIENIHIYIYIYSVCVLKAEEFLWVELEHYYFLQG
jgi:hypothetical protein